MEKDKFIKGIESEQLTAIKAGQNDHDFLNIWMVVVNNRIFARSWGFAERSWYNTFLKDNIGQIKSGDYIFNIKGEIPEDFNELVEPINEAYMKTYNFGSNAFYAEGITKEEHINKTMEFILLDEVK